jgi:hypothetical protein
MRLGSKLLALALLALTPACAVEPRMFCNRLSFCSLFSIGVDTCIERMDEELDGLSPEGRAEFEVLLAGCLGLPTCDTFFVCVETFPGAAVASEPGAQLEPGSTPISTPAAASSSAGRSDAREPGP